MTRWADCAPDTPVIVGVGEAIDRPADLTAAKHPVALMADALRAAEADAGAALIDRFDTIEAILQITWPYPDAGAALAGELGIHASRVRYGAHGGHSPMKAIHDAALRISRGEARAVAVCGGEAYSSLSKAQKAGTDLPWPEPGPPLDMTEKRSGGLPPAAITLGASLPIAIYPFYENATAAAWGQSPAEAHAESGRIWSAFSHLAADHSIAWIRTAFSDTDVTEPTADNRPIAWPYTKRMVANPIVNQGAAVIVTSLGLARELGIAEDRLIAVHGGAAADEPGNFLERDSYAQAPAQTAVLETAAALADDFTAVELYSCFPVVPKMARRVLGLTDDMPLSLIGGLSFFGGPLNNYMTHAACAMVRRLRADGGKGLLYAQGGYVTWHHALVLARDPGPPLAADYAVQADADGKRGPVPPLDQDYRGPAMLETFTVPFNRAGDPRHGIAILCSPDRRRLIARVSDAAGIARLTDSARTPIGSAGTVTDGQDGVPEWRFAGAG